MSSQPLLTKEAAERIEATIREQLRDLGGSPPNLGAHIQAIADARNAVCCVRRDVKCTYADEKLVDAAESILLVLLAMLQTKRDLAAANGAAK